MLLRAIVAALTLVVVALRLKSNRENVVEIDRGREGNLDDDI